MSDSANTITSAFAAQILARVVGFSRYARRLIEHEPDLLPRERLDTPFTANEMHAFLAITSITNEQALWHALRMLRKKVMLRMMARDLGKLATLDEVVATMTALAEVTVTFAVEHIERWLAAQHGTPLGDDSHTPQKLHVIGMGKLGGSELNVSSDIDLIFVYPEEGKTNGVRSLSNHEFFSHLARRLIAALNEVTTDGLVFRVDMRLRPWGTEGSLVCGFETLENYFVAHGREWERYAWIKARTMCGDRAAELTALVQPFVFRRHLDYSAFESLSELHREVRNEVERRDIADNIKLGPGGIREIEFIAQLFQLVRGGRDSALREPSTMKILPLLATRGLLSHDVTQALGDAYVFLRNLEHRLQYLDDQQTHVLPDSIADRTLIATAMDCSDSPQLQAQLDRHRASVTRCFESIFVNMRDEKRHPLTDLWFAALDDSKYTAQLLELGYREPPRVMQRLAALRAGHRLQQMPDASRGRVQQIVPLIIAAAAHQPDPEATFERMLDLLESISRREAYLALLLQYPYIIERSTRLAGASPWAASYLARHPILLDELLDDRVLAMRSDWQQLREQLRAELDSCGGDIDHQMDTLRHFKHSHVMRLIMRDLAGELPLEKLSDYLSDLANTILDETLRVAWQGLRNKYRDVPRFAVIAYGKLGGKELDYASDLDLIFLYDDAAPEAQENYARLAQKINHWLTSLTAAGLLYAVDLRLRPDGASGLLVSAIEGFDVYQKKQAWVWEHQALTRARFVAGTVDIGERFEQIRFDILRRARDLPRLREEVVTMRKRIFDAHPNPSGEFDIKHSHGGLIDVEFIVQYLVLGYAHRHAELTNNIGNLALLKLAAQLKLIGSSQALAAHDAYRTLRQLQHSSRLRGEKHARIEKVSIANEAAAVRKLWQEVFAT